MTREAGKILLTGATGYIGGRLLKRLEARGADLVCLARKPAWLRARCGPKTKVYFGDLLEPGSLAEPMKGVRTAYYLVHALGENSGFEQKEESAARNFSEAAVQAGVERVVYVSGLGGGRELSPHLRSRHRTGEILRASGLHVVELRASIVLGAGSISFEMIRSLVQKLPVMTAPRWVHVKAQPIAISDLLDFMEQAAELELPRDAVVEIGGAEVTTYAGIMKEYARQRGLRRWIIPVPVLSPWLSSLWLGLVTPLFARVGRKLIDSIRHPTIVENPSGMALFSVRPAGLREAIERAVAEEEKEILESRWSDSLSSSAAYHRWGGTRFRTRLADTHQVHVPLPPEQVFAPVQRIGGAQGWYAFNSLWKLRAMLDVLVGGVGLRRGRPHPVGLRVGDQLDWWRVERFEPGSLLRLYAEMKLPGRAWLEFEVTPAPGGSTLTVTAVFDPVGVQGLLYWYSVYPLHALVFRGMLRGIAREAQSEGR